jgi:gamma-tubulin complex component 2
VDFNIAEELDPSLADLITRMLPICSNYLKICSFVDERSSFEYGRVHHSVSACLREILQEYHILVAQLEHESHTNGDFTFQKLWYYITPSLGTFNHISQLIDSIEEKVNFVDQKFQLFSDHGNAQFEKIGGMILSLLADRLILHGGYFAY